MNSTTGDFSVLRRGITEIDTNRKSQSVVKTRKRVPQSNIQVKPLNLNEIRQEIAESLAEKDIGPLTDISNIAEVPVKSENKSSNNNVAKSTKENDSFDLNFSALSLVTPIKKSEPMYVTPKIEKTAFVSCAKPVKFTNFVTPTVEQRKQNKILYSASKTCPTSITKTPASTLKINKIDEDFKGEVEMTKDYENKMVQTISTSSPVELLDRLVVKNVEYLVLNMLGKGGSSEVFACFCPLDKKHVAVKSVSLQNHNSSGYINEVKLLQKLQTCDKIIKMYDYEILVNEKKLFVVLEQGGDDLATILKKVSMQKSHIPFYMVFFYWMEMLYAVQQIHSNGVIHSDLKPANFLKAEGGLKLIDFGIASSVQLDMTSVFKTTQEGSCNYISPEALNQESANESAAYKLHYKSDVWSLGCILYQLVYKKTPFQHIHILWKKLAVIMDPNHVIEFPAVDWVPLKIIDTMKKCLQYQVKLRPSIDDLIEEYEKFWCQNCFAIKN